MAVIVVFLCAALVIAAVPLFVWARAAYASTCPRGNGTWFAREPRNTVGDGRVPTMRQVVLEQDATTRIVQPISEWAIRTAPRERRRG